MAEKRFGVRLEGWTPPPRPPMGVLEGRYARLVRLEADAHAADLHRANSADDAIWDYMPQGPFSDFEAYQDWMAENALGADPMFHTIVNLETVKLKQ